MTEALKVNKTSNLPNIKKRLNNECGQDAVYK